MKIKVLGCSGAELPGHNTPGFLLDDEILLDAGSLTNVLDSKKQWKIKNIFVTHAHLDHIKGIPFLADNLIIRNKGHKVNIAGISPVIDTIKHNLINGSLWPDFTILPNPRNGVLRFVHLREGRAMTVDGYSVTPFKVNHSVPAAGYLVEDAKGKRLFYTGDTGPTHATWRKIGDRPLNGLIIEVSFPNKMEQTAVATGHMTANLLRAELSKMPHMPGKIFITHTKPQYARIINKELQNLGMKNVRVLRDGEVITV
jgi:ribonuclease BN (tRNA processing enzyme)